MVAVEDSGLLIAIERRGTPINGELEGGARSQHLSAMVLDN